jgi:hypothetical protein
MAELRTQPVLQDTGSEEVKKLRLSFNALATLVGDLLDEIEGAADLGALQTATTALLAQVETDTATVVLVGGEPGVPERPSRPVTS